MFPLLELIFDIITPRRKLRHLRREWVSKVTLPKYEGDVTKGKISKEPPMSIHPSIDPYITCDERLCLLIAYGWVKPVTINGETWYYQVKHWQIFSAMGKYLSKQAFMSEVSSSKIVSCTGEKY